MVSFTAFEVRHPSVRTRVASKDHNGRSSKHAVKPLALPMIIADLISTF
jgi:hypothetical protein